MKPWLWITDPWNTLDHPRDTTLRLIEACLKLRQPVAWADVRSLRWQNGIVKVDAALLDSKTTVARDLRTGRPLTHFTPLQVTDFSQIHYRVDPPVDLAYLHPLQMLEQVVPRRLVNPARAIALLSEKTIPASLPLLWPESLVCSSLDTLIEFVRHQKTAVLKPLHGAQSQGVEKLSADTPFETLRQKLSTATADFTRPVLLQQYLSEITRSGETRLWFVDGKLLACAQKVPAPGDFKINMDAGSTLKRIAGHAIAPGFRPALRLISRWLVKNRVRLAAVDWIDGKITDFNITSPGLLVAMEALLKQDLAHRVVRQLQRRFSSEKAL